MSHTARRLALTTTALLALTLAACTNPVAPAAPRGAETRTAPEARPSAAGVYMGSVG